MVRRKTNPNTLFKPGPRKRSGVRPVFANPTREEREAASAAVRSALASGDPAAVAREIAVSLPTLDPDRTRELAMRFLELVAF